jgi:hypothetical protein
MGESAASWALELDGDALFAHIAEEPKKMSDSEELADLLAEIDELEAGASRPG